MDSMENYLETLDTIKDYCQQICGTVLEKINQRYVVLPATGVFLFYMMFVREISGKKRPRDDKEPCNADEEYNGNEYPDVAPVS